MVQERLKPAPSLCTVRSPAKGMIALAWTWHFAGIRDLRFGHALVGREVRQKLVRVWSGCNSAAIRSGFRSCGNGGRLRRVILAKMNDCVPSQRSTSLENDIHWCRIDRRDNPPLAALGDVNPSLADADSGRAQLWHKGKVCRSIPRHKVGTPEFAVLGASSGRHRLRRRGTWKPSGYTA